MITEKNTVRILCAVIGVLGLLATSPGWAEITITNLRTLNDPDGNWVPSLSPDGGYCIRGGRSSIPAKIFRTSDNTLMGSCTMPGAETSESVAIAENGAVSLVGSVGSVICGFDLSGNRLWTTTVPSGEWQVAVREDGMEGYAGYGDDFYRLRCSDGAILANETINTRGWGIWEISTSTDGSVVLLQTNSDIIITDADGSELQFFDIVTGNYLSNADLSPDGSHFAVSYLDPADSNYYVALYSRTAGELWKEQVGNGTYVRVDNRNWVFAGISDVTDNKLFSPYGHEIGTFNGANQYLDITPDGRYCLKANYNIDCYFYEIEDNYTCYPELPRPSLFVTGVNQKDGEVEYELSIANYSEYADELFEVAPELAPCGPNYNSHRTWLDIYDETGSMLYGYCVLNDASSLESLSFSIPETPLPTSLYVTLEDRKCQQTVTSVPVSTERGCPPGDLNADCQVNLLDFAIMSGHWLTEGINYADLNNSRIAGMASQMSDDDIDSSDGNELLAGSYFVYETNEGRYGKAIVEQYDFASGHPITLGWTTYNADGTTYSSGTGLLINGTWTCDLDEGLETSTGGDFQWRMQTGTTRDIHPLNGATFELLHRVD